MRTIATILAAMLAVALATSAFGQDEAAWTSRVTEDDFAESTIHIASVGVDGNPYKWARLFMNCHNGTSFNFGLAFGYLNLTGGDWIGGSKHYRVGVKYGSSPAQTKLLQESADGDTIWLDKEDLTDLYYVPETENFAVRLPYYRDGNVTIRFPMTGSREAIATVVDACKTELGLVAELVAAFQDVYKRKEREQSESDQPQEP